MSFIAQAVEKDLVKHLAMLDEKHQEYVAECDAATEPNRIAFFRGKKEAYGYAAKKVREILRWHGVIDSPTTTQL